MTTDMPRPKSPLCPHCRQRMPSGPTLINQVHDYLLGRADAEYVVRSTSYEIAKRLAVNPSSVATILRKFEAEGIISWKRGKRGNGRGVIRLLA